MAATPHREKLAAALRNPKCGNDDRALLTEARRQYERWLDALQSLTTSGQERVRQMTDLLNNYKDLLEIDLIARQGSPFIKRQKGQLKLDNSVLEEFLVHLVHPAVIEGLPENLELTVGPTRAFMSLSFTPVDLPGLGGRPQVVIKKKDQDFIIGKDIHYKLSPDADFPLETTAAGSFPPCSSCRRVQGEPGQDDVPGGGRNRGPIEAGMSIRPVLRAKRVPGYGAGGCSTHCG